MRKSIKLLAVIVAALLVAALAFTASASFTDVSLGDDYFSAIAALESIGIVEGDGSGKFNPDDKVTRAEFVKMLYVAMTGKEELPLYNGMPVFEDVEDGSWYTPYINWAAAKGIVNGYGNGKFGPNDQITVAQIAKILYIAKNGVPAEEVSFPYGYVVKANDDGLLSGLLGNVAHMTAAASRDEAAQFIFNILNVECDMAGGVRPATLFNNGNTAADGVTVRLIGAPSDTNNGKGLTKVTKANQYAFAVIEWNPEANNGQGDYELTHITTVELDKALNIPVGAPVILSYEKGKDADGNMLEGWYNAAKITDVQAGYTSYVTKTVGDITYTDVTLPEYYTVDPGPDGEFGTDDDIKYNKTMTYSFGGVAYEPENGWYLPEHLIVKTADGSVRGGYMHFYYCSDNDFSIGYDYRADARYKYNDTYVDGDLAWNSGFIALGKAFGKEPVTFYDTDGDGFYEELYYNPIFTAMEITTLTDTKAVLSDTRGNCEYWAGLNIKASQLATAYPLFEGDFVNLTVHTGLDGIPMYDVQLANTVTGVYHGGAMNANNQMSNVTIGSSNYGVAFNNIPHAEASYKQLYTRFGVVNGSNIGKTFTLVLDTRGGIARVILHKDAAAEQEFKLGDLNVAKVVSVDRVTVQGDWDSDVELRVTLETLDGKTLTVVALDDLKVVVNAAYETLNNISEYGNAWLDGEFGIHGFVFDDEGKQPLIVGQYVHYELNEKGKLALLMSINDVLNGYDLPTDAVVNGYNYTTASGKIEWATRYSAIVYKEDGATKSAFLADGAKLMYKKGGKIVVEDLASHEAFKNATAKAVMLDGKVLLMFVEAFEEGTTISTDTETTIKYAFLDRFWVESGEEPTFKAQFTSIDGETYLYTLKGEYLAEYWGAELQGNENYLYTVLIGDGAIIYLEKGLPYNTVSIGTTPALSAGVVVRGYNEFIYIRNVAGLADGVLSLNEKEVWAKLADDVKVYVLSGKANYFEGANGTFQVKDVTRSRIADGTTADILMANPEVVKPILYSYEMDENGLCTIDQVIVIDVNFASGEYSDGFDTAEVDTTVELGEYFGTTYDNNGTNIPQFNYGDEINFNMQTVIVTVNGEAHEFAGIVKAAGALDKGVGVHTANVYVDIEGERYEFELDYYVKAASAAEITGTSHIEIRKLPDKTFYTYISEEEGYGPVDLTGIEVYIVSDDTGEYMMAQPNQYKADTTTITATTTEVVVRAFGMTASYPITAEAITVTNVWLVSTPHHSARAYNGIKITNYATGVTTTNSTASTGLAYVGNFGFGVENVLQYSVIGSTAIAGNGASFAVTTVKLADSLSRAEVDALWGLPVKLTIDPAAKEVLAVETIGPAKALTSDRVDAVSWDGGSAFFIDGENIPNTFNVPGKRVAYNTSSGGFFTNQVLQGTAGFNSGLITEWDGHENQYNTTQATKYANNRTAPDIVYFEDMNNDGVYDWCFLRGVTIGKSSSDRPGLKFAFDDNSANGNNYTLTGAGGSAWLTTGTTATTYFLGDSTERNVGAVAGEYYYIRINWGLNNSGFAGSYLELVHKGEALSGLALEYDIEAETANELTAENVTKATALMYGVAECLVEIDEFTVVDDYHILVTAHHEGTGETITETVTLLVPDTLTITKNPSKTNYLNGELIDLSGVKAEIAYKDGTVLEVSGDALELVKDRADIDDQFIYIAVGELAAEPIAITVNENSGLFVVAATYEYNIRNGSSALVNTPNHAAIIPYGEAVISANAKIYAIGEAINPNAVPDAVGGLAYVTINANGEIAEFEALESHAVDASEIAFDAETGVFTIHGEDAAYNEAMISEYTLHSWRYNFISLACDVALDGSAWDIYGQDDMYMLFDADADGEFDFISCRVRYNAAQIVDINEEDGTIKLGGTVGSNSSTGWQNYASNTATWQYVNPYGLELAVGDYVNISYTFDKTITGTSGGNANFPTRVVIIEKSGRETGLVENVEKSEDLLDITFTLNGDAYAWTTAVENFDYADGLAANGYNRAGRDAFTNGYFTVYFDANGHAVRAVEAGDKLAVFVSDSIAEGGYQSFTYESVDYNVDLMEVDELQDGKWYNVVVVDGNVVAAEEAEALTVVILAKDGNTVTYSLDGTTEAGTLTLTSTLSSGVLVDTVTRFVFNSDGEVVARVEPNVATIDSVKVALTVAFVEYKAYAVGDHVNKSDFIVKITFADGSESEVYNWKIEREADNEVVEPEDYTVTENDINEYGNFMAVVNVASNGGNIKVYNDYVNETFFGE